MDELHKIASLPVFTIGGVQSTLGTLLSAFIVVIATILIAQLVKKSVHRALKKLDDKEAHLARIFGIVTQIIIWIVGLEIVLNFLGIQLTTLFAASGFLALGAGFAVKNIVENFLSGSILKLEKTIRPGDLIIVRDKWMFIQNIGLRVTTALTYSGEEVLIPNSLIAQSLVTNLTRNNRFYRIEVKLGVSYDSDLDLVRKTLEQAIEKLEWRSKAKEPILFLDEFGDSSVNYSVDVWVDDANDSRGRKSDLHEAVWWALKDKNITIAYPQVDLHLDQNVIDAMANKHS